MKEQDNKGFTLIEILVAVMVLAVVIVPLLHSFVSSHRVNAKSREVMRATTLAQNEMEMFEKESLAALIAMTNAADPTQPLYTVTAPDPTNPASDGCYTFERAGIVNDESGRSMFDVVVTLNPERENTSDRYYTQNTEELMTMNTISNVDSGSFVQSIRSPNNAADYDSVVYGIFKERKAASGVGAAWDVSDFEQNLKRKIIVKITQMDDALGKITKATVTYEYTCDIYGVMPNEYKTYSEEKLMFDNAQSLDAGGNRIELKSLYLFYAPRYNTANEDVIVIQNEENLPIDIYIIRQDIWGSATDVVQKVPASYQAKIEINDRIQGGQTAARYWTNLNLDAPAIEGNGRIVNLSLKDYGNPSRVFSVSEIKDATQIRLLGDTEAKDRIYTMEVRVYRAGADRTTEQPLVTMTGSKLE